MARYWLSPVISGGGISVTFTQVAAAASPRYIHAQEMLDADNYVLLSASWYMLFDFSFKQ